MTIPCNPVYQSLDSLISTVCFIINELLNCSNLQFFENYIKSILKINNSKHLLKCLLRYKYLKEISYAFIIYKDDSESFNYLNDIFKDTDPKLLFLSKLDFSKYIGFISLKNQYNQFTKLLYKYNNITHYYLIFINNSEKCLKLIKKKINFKTLIEHHLSNNELIKYNLRNSLFISKNINYLLEFADIINFSNDNDYHIICRFYKDKSMYNSFIKSFINYFPDFSIERFFIECLKLDNVEMSKLVFENYYDKQKLIKIDLGSAENILHLLVKKNNWQMIEIICKIIDQSEKKDLLYEEKEIDNDIKLPTPIKFSIQSTSYEAFVILYNYYKRDYLNSLVADLNNTEFITELISKFNSSNNFNAFIKKHCITLFINITILT